MDLIKPFGFRAQKTLPTVFEDELSYYEVLCKLTKKLNECIEVLNEFDINKFQQELDELRGYVDTELTEMLNYTNGIKDTLISRMNQLEANTGNQLRLFQNQLDLQDAKIETEFIGINATTDAKIKQNNDYLLDIISKEIISVKVLNPFTGEMVTIQQMIEYLSSLHQQNAITYTALSNRNKTYNQLAGYDMTYTQLAFNGNTIIV